MSWNKRETEKPSKEDLYKIAIETRNLEIGLFWQRSNYFLILNTALAVGFFKVGNVYAIAISIFGAFVSLLWFRVNLGSKFWQSRWEERLRIQEKQVAPNLNFFTADDDLLRSDVENHINRRSSRPDWFKRWIDRQTLRRLSVSYNMTLLSLLFIGGWSILLFIQLMMCCG